MKQIFEKYGDFILAVITAVAMSGFLFTFVNAGGLLGDWIMEYEKLVCIREWRRMI